jgi:PKD repeat protein
MVTICAGYTLVDSECNPPDGSLIPVNPEIQITLNFTGRVDTFTDPEVRPVLRRHSDGQAIGSLPGSSEQVTYWYNPYGQTTMTRLVFTKYYSLDPAVQYDLHVLDEVMARYSTPSPGVLCAAFTAIPREGAAPLTVQFIDTSSGSPTSWAWNFGDGTSSTLQNPGHTYGTAGTYRASLTVSNAGGASHTSTRTITVKYVQASGSASPTTGAAPLMVRFIDTSTGSPDSWLWNFGDGTTSDLQNPSHTYETEGVYHVVLSAQKTVGDTNYGSNYYDITITVTAPSGSVVTVPGGLTCRRTRTSMVNTKM